MTATVFTAAVAELGMAPATAMVTATAMAMDVAPATAMVTATAMDMATDMAMATEMGMVAATASATDMAVYRVATERSNKQTTTNCNTFKTMIESKPKSHPHAALIKAWADGAKIQFYSKSEQKWLDVAWNHPSWTKDEEYRIKPEEPSNEPWKPKKGERYFFVLIHVVYKYLIEISHSFWENDALDKKLYDIGNCFRTVEEAKAAIPRVKDALKGATDVSANVGSNVGSPEIDGKPLTDGEKALIRAFRNGRLCRQFSNGSSLIVEGHDKVPNGVTTHREFVAFFMYSPMQDGEVRNALEKIKAEQEASNEAE
jgi:hypothetical protein